MKLPIQCWGDDLDDNAAAQAKNIASLSFAFHHIAMMPDAHVGYGMPIGGVLATTDAIIPNAVGVDIGCGVAAHRTTIKSEYIPDGELKNVMGKIREKVPVGFLSHKEPKELPSHLQNEPEIDFAHLDIDGLPIKSIIQKAKYQAGTLGGGNHFIEIQKDEEDFIWVMVHSGSRNVGYTIANYFNKLAVKLNKKWLIGPALLLNADNNLAYLPILSQEGYNYIESMLYATEFAKFNRYLIMRECILALQNRNDNQFFQFQHYDICHNYAELENHFGSNVWVHRKGAIKARKDDVCIIPGSQGSNSYIGAGLGNPDSFTSCSHGAGRRMGRMEARKSLSIDNEKKILDEMGVIHSIRNQKDLDEAPSAYKDIDKVMEAQKDLVRIVHKLTPIAVIKG